MNDKYLVYTLSKNSTSTMCPIGQTSQNILVSHYRLAWILAQPAKNTCQNFNVTKNPKSPQKLPHNPQPKFTLKIVPQK